MAKVENLEPPRDGLIRQEIISHEEDQKGLITVKRVIRHYHEDCMDFIEFPNAIFLNIFSSVFLSNFTVFIVCSILIIFVYAIDKAIDNIYKVNMYLFIHNKTIKGKVKK